VVLATAGVSAQGVTNASMQGRITDQNSGEELIGANVVVVHEPTGTVYGNSTDLDGFFRLPNLRVGGPYKVTVSYTGYETKEETGIYLALGQTYRLNLALGEAAIELGGVEVTASRSNIFQGDRNGQETVIDETTINELPTVTRAIADFVRLNPLASLDEGNDGFSISLAGQNNRFNTVYIDGAVNNDVFGLAGSGFNGGQTGASPISIDAIEQFTVSVAPFDVRQSGFAGGAINAVTRSGTNDFEGSAYYFLRNESLTRSEAFTNADGFNFNEIAEFSAQTYGFRLGGPVVKDKLFFFVNAELQRNETPQPFDFDNYRGDITREDLNQFENFLRSEYNYDPGSFDNNTAFLDTDFIIGKLDWNISPTNKLSLRHSFNRAENLEARSSNPSNISYINGSEYFVSETNSTALELSTLFGNNMSNNLTVGVTIVRDDRDPFGDPFPAISLQDGDEGNINFGAETFSTANLLNQDVVTINNDFQIFKGRHNFLIGANFEYFNAGNLFIRDNYGEYGFDNQNDGTTGVERFIAGAPADFYDLSFSQVDLATGDESQAIAEFESIQFGLYVQDEWQVSDRVNMTFGIRADAQTFPTDLPLNRQFNSDVIPLIESFGYDLEGARTGQEFNSRIYFSPRVGFNADLTGDRRTQLRGGLGVFTSRLPLVWLGGAYNNYGFNIGGLRRFDEVTFVPDVNNQPLRPTDLTNPTPSGQVDIFSPNYRLPQLFRANLALDQRIGDRFYVTLEGLYSKSLSAIRYQNFNLKPATLTLQGSPDNRPIYDTRDEVDDTYTGIFLGSNTAKGFSYNGVLTLGMVRTNGISAQVSYTYSDAFSLYDGTSSQNNSQWRGFYNVAGRNYLNAAQRSNFAAQHRVIGQASYSIDYGGFARSQFSLFMNAQSGRPYTYVVGARNRDFVNDGGFDFNEVWYVPASFEEANLIDMTDRDGNVTMTARDQWQLLDEFIEADSYLSERRGMYTERNASFAPFTTIFDFRFLQDFYIETGSGKRNTLQLSVDIFNLANLLDQDWGRVYSTGFGTFAPVNLQNSIGPDNLVPEYTINSEVAEGLGPDEVFNDNLVSSGRIRSSRWNMQVGLRYIFQ
jgi:hypothetical protein